MTNGNWLKAPTEIFVNGRKMSREEFVARTSRSDIPKINAKSFAVTRINGVVKLYVVTA